MEAYTSQVAPLLADQEVLSPEHFDKLMQQVHSGARPREQFQQELQEIVAQQAEALQADAVQATKIGQAYYALDDYANALQWLEKSGAGERQCYLKGCCLRSLADYSGAIAQFEEAQSKGHDSFAAAMLIVDCLRRAGELETAAERLKRFARVGEIRAEYHFQLGRLHEANGQHQEAIDEYERTIRLDANHTEALFFLAYACDLYGDEAEAIKYYNRSIESGSVHVSVLLNLAVLYEDAERYEKAQRCVRQVLASYPNHPRARLFLKDINSSLTMYYDEDQKERIDRRNQILKIPISDFELSVRSRNCLRRMSIRCLGDLLKVTESELLAYKNFGETSLDEIKATLRQKGLRLGQMLEDRKSDLNENSENDPASNTNNELYSMSLAELAFSVRARRCLQRLNINTVGDLTQCTEAELLGVKNFGLTSLTEIKEKAKEYGFALRKLDE